MNLDVFYLVTDKALTRWALYSRLKSTILMILDLPVTYMTIPRHFHLMVA